MGYLHNGILLGCKEEESFYLYDSTDGPGEHYANWYKPIRERKIWFHSFVGSNEQTKLTRKMGTDS